MRGKLLIGDAWTEGTWDNLTENGSTVDIGSIEQITVYGQLRWATEVDGGGTVSDWSETVTAELNGGT